MAARGMEGGSPSLVKQRWTMPMYFDQLRYWADNPPLDVLARAYFKIKPKKTPPRKRGEPLQPAIDRSALTAPLTPAELGTAKAIEQIKV